MVTERFPMNHYFSKPYFLQRLSLSPLLSESLSSDKTPPHFPAPTPDLSTPTQNLLPTSKLSFPPVFLQFFTPCLAQSIRSHWHFSINTESLVCVPHSAQKKWTDFDISHLALLLSTPLGMVQIFVSCYFELFTFFKKQNCCNQFLSWSNFFSALY